MHFLLFLIAAPFAYALKCYECIEIGDGSSACSDATVTECDDLCMTKQTFDGDRSIYMRYCGTVDDECNQNSVTCDVCDTELCNDVVFTTTDSLTTTVTITTEETSSGITQNDAYALLVLLLINQL